MRKLFRDLLVNLIAGILLTLPLFLIVIAGSELYLRLKGRELFPGYQPCLVFDSQTHHRYLPRCHSETEGSFGKINYDFNEHGFRDRPSPELRSGPPVLVALGDSITEGIFLPAEQSIPRRLEAILGTRVLNAGVRFASPTTEAILYRREIEPSYPVIAVLWLLNPGDGTDERLFQAEAVEVNEGGEPVRFAWIGAVDPKGLWISRANQWNRGRSLLVDFLLRLETFRRFRESIQSIGNGRNQICRGIFSFARHLKEKKVPLLIAFTPHPVSGIERNWAGEPYRPEELRTMVACARETGAMVADFTGEEIHPEHYLSDDMHFNAAGAEWVAEKLKPFAQALLAKGKCGGKAKSDCSR